MISIDRTHKVALVILVSVAFAFIFLCIINEIKRKSLIHYNKQLMANLSAEIDSYKKLGFTADDKIMHHMQLRMSHLQKRLDVINTHRRIIFNQKLAAVVKKEQVEELLTLDQQIAQNYRSEIEQCMKLGIAQQCPTMHSAKNNLTLLTTEIASLQDVLCDQEKNKYKIAFEEKISRILQITQQSLDEYKQEAAHQSAHDNQEYINFVRACITAKVSEIAALERQL